MISTTDNNNFICGNLKDHNKTTGGDTNDSRNMITTQPVTDRGHKLFHNDSRRKKEDGLDECLPIGRENLTTEVDKEQD